MRNPEKSGEENLPKQKKAMWLHTWPTLELLPGSLRVWLQPEFRIRIAALSALAGQGAPGALKCSQTGRGWVANRMEQMGIVGWAAQFINVTPPPPQHPDAQQQHSCQGESKGLEGLKTTFEQPSRSH